MKKLKKENKSRIILIGSFLIIIVCTSIVFFKIFNQYKIDQSDKEKLIDFFENEEQIIIDSEAVSEEEKIVEEIKPVSNDQYIAVLEIKKIDLIRGIYAKDSKLNNVNKNIELNKDSNMPDEENGNVIIAGHSGNSKVSFFSKLFKLSISNEAIIYYQGKSYIYKLVNSYEIEKNGRANIVRNGNKNTLTLITCKGKNKQVLFIFELVSIE